MHSAADPDQNQDLLTENAKLRAKVRSLEMENTLLFDRLETVEAENSTSETANLGEVVKRLRVIEKEIEKLTTKHTKVNTVHDKLQIAIAVTLEFSKTLHLLLKPRSATILKMSVLLTDFVLIRLQPFKRIL